MKKTLVPLVILITMLCLSGCDSREDKLNYGTYTVEELSYLSPLSSWSFDYLNKGMAGYKCEITKDKFKFAELQNVVEKNSPQYIREEFTNKSAPLFDAKAFFGKAVKYQYSIYDEDGQKVYWRIYASKDSLWLVSYNDNTANGSEIIMTVYRLAKE